MTVSVFEESVRSMTPVRVPESERDRVRALLALVQELPSEEPAAYKLVSPNGDVTEVPASIFALLEHMLEVLARGDALTMVPVGKELTTQQAANLLNISRQYFVRLLDQGHIPFHRTGTHRRVRMEDVVGYKRQRDLQRSASLDDLAAMSQDFGGYDELGQESG